MTVVLTVLFVLALVAFFVCIYSAVRPGPPPFLWVAVLLLCIIEMLRVLPLGK